MYFQVTLYFYDHFSDMFNMLSAIFFSYSFDSRFFCLLNRCMLWRGWMLWRGSLIKCDFSMRSNITSVVKTCAKITLYFFSAYSQISWINVIFDDLFFLFRCVFDVLRVYSLQSDLWYKFDNIIFILSENTYFFQFKMCSEDLLERFVLLSYTYS